MALPFPAYLLETTGLELIQGRPLRVGHVDGLEWHVLAQLIPDPNRQDRARGAGEEGGCRWSGSHPA